MRAYVENFLKEYNYPEESWEVLLSAFDKLQKHEEFNSLIENFFKTKPDFRAIMKALCEKTDLNLYTGYGVLFICLSKETKVLCKKWNWTDDMFRRGMLDIMLQTCECYEVKKVWGLMGEGWMAGIVTGNVVSIGRLQFVPKRYSGEDIEVAGYTLKKGDEIITVHIPGSGEAFDEAARMDAYGKAYEFYGNANGNNPCFSRMDDYGKTDKFCDFADGKTPCIFFCQSWLLFPPNREILNPNSNIISFMNEFKILDTLIFGEDEVRQDLWRIFGQVDEDVPFENFPERTSLQRAYKKFLTDGNMPGQGLGVFIYDGENKKILK